MLIKASLTQHKKKLQMKLLSEECHLLAKSEEEIGCVGELELEINLSDERPIQKSYTVVPKHLYGEVRHYVEDFSKVFEI